MKRKETTLTGGTEELEIKKIYRFEEVNDPDTAAIVIDDYPYGFNKRCKIRYWLEAKKHKGYRFCSQTFYNGKWNAPKKSTYNFIMIVYELENGHISYDSLYGGYGYFQDFVKFETELWDYLSYEQKKDLQSLFILSKKYSPSSWEEWQAKGGYNFPKLNEYMERIK